MNRINLINQLIKRYGYKRYLEIGVDRGFCYTNIVCEVKECVDPGYDDGQTDHGGDNIFYFDEVTYKTYSDDFFRDFAPNNEKYDLIFIDGLHHSDQVDRDIQNSLKYLSKGGTIVLHDCNPMTEASQIVPRIQMYWHGDVWKSVVKFRESNTEYGSIVIDSDCGLGVIKEGIDYNMDVEFPDELTYTWLDENRLNALNLVSVEEGKKILDIE